MVIGGWWFFVVGGFFGGAGDGFEIFFVEVGGVVSQAHEDADAVVALALEKRGGDGGIDSAGHGDNDFLFGGHGEAFFCREHYSGWIAGG